MKTSNSNVIVYVKQPVHREQARAISETLGALHGVIKTQTSQRTGSVISVDYDPRSIDSQHILQSVSEQGYNARLVGM
jgi:copper chaperone CopZ